ncbi:MAG: hypothetical protein LUH05_00380 [Candidatus Gastranaerophilales bacterium]|nr:hypothetical protein [Candidatus Gastranaerophilales bacterium]
MGTLQIKRGLAENLPEDAEAGELLYTTDTKKFYIGNGSEADLTEFSNSSQLSNYLDKKAESEHSHESSEITDFDSEVDSRIDMQKGEANGLATLDTTGKIPNSQIPNSFKEASVVENITERDALDAFAGLHAFVVDASADDTVGSGGGAEYVYNGSAWIKISEFNNLDTLVDWSNVQNKPDFVSSLSDLDDFPSLEGQGGMLLMVLPDESGVGFVAPFDGNFDGGLF